MSDLKIWYGTADEDTLYHDDLNDFVESYLDQMWPAEKPETIEVYTYKQASITRFPRVLDDVLESLDEEYSHASFYDEPTPAMIAAEKAFIDVIKAEYEVHRCDRVDTPIVINCADWIKEHAPEWLASPQEIENE